MRKLRFLSSLRTKFALSYFAVVAIVLLLINTFFLTASRDIIFSMKRSFVESQAALIAAHLEEAFISLSGEDEERIAAIVSLLEVAEGTHIIIADDSGNIVYDPMQRSVRENFPAHYIDTALEDYDVFFAEFIGGTFYSSAFTPVMSQGTLIGILCFSDEDTDQGSLLLNMQRTIMNISVIVSAISIFIIILIVLPLGRRLNSIVRAVKSVREGEYSYTIGMSGRDELALLSDEFNSLTERLRETDEIRRRFVADASHELKTPLATIRLLTDSILQNRNIDSETALEFIGDINMEAERLGRTTDKLMTLTRLDSHIEDERVRVNLKNAVMASIRMLKSLAEKKKVVIRARLSEGCYIRATEESAHHIIFNLMENAIKYNKPGGSVQVTLDAVGSEVKLVVKDRGIGVPEEDLPYIFDRFYRVDKARTRDTAAVGSGLGLAIVRDTVRDLGGDISVEQRKNGGMVFAVTLKKDDEVALNDFYR